MRCEKKWAFDLFLTKESAHSEPIVMTKNHFKLAIASMRMKLAIRLAMYCHFVHGVPQAAVAKAIGREASAMSERATAVKNKLKETILAKDYAYGEFILPRKMIEGLQDLEDSFHKGDMKGCEVVDAFAEANDKKDLLSLMGLQKLLLATREKNKKKASGDRIAALLEDLDIVAPKDPLSLDELEETLKLMLIVIERHKNQPSV
jgi:hypothetical protein